MQITGALSLPCFVLLHVITIQRSLSKFQSNNTDSNTNIERILHDRFITSLKNKEVEYLCYSHSYRCSNIKDKTKRANNYKTKI